MKKDGKRESKNPLPDGEPELPEVSAERLGADAPDEPQQDSHQYPKGTVLIGGHPRWQKFFAQNHPHVKILDGNRANFRESAITEATPLVLVNTTHMCHAVYRRLRKVLDKAGVKWDFIYPRYRSHGDKSVIK